MWDGSRGPEHVSGFSILNIMKHFKAGSSINKNLVLAVGSSPQAYIVLTFLIDSLEDNGTITISNLDISKSTGLSVRAVRTGLTVIKKLYAVSYFRKYTDDPYTYRINTLQLL